MIGCLSPPGFLTSANTKADGAIKSKQVVMRYFNRAANSFPFLVSDTISQEFRLCVFHLHEHVSNSRKVLLQRYDFHAIEKTGGIQELLAFKYQFRVVRHTLIEFTVAADDFVSRECVTCDQDTADLVGITFGNLKRDTHSIVRLDAADNRVNANIGETTRVVQLRYRRAGRVDSRRRVRAAFFEKNRVS